MQILKAEGSGCNPSPKGTYADAEVHRWVTDPMKSNFIMTGTTAPSSKVTIEFYTRTLNDVENIKGELCVYLFKREEKEEKGSLVATDTPLTNKSGNTPYWTYTPENNGWWPSKSWVQKLLTMYFNGAPYTIPVNDRLGVAISVDREGTDGDAIPIMYDHPSYPTRIEVDTSTPIEGG